MIPKVIHYCWISDENTMPHEYKKCVESWKKYLPDYKFINWNDSKFDWNICEFTKYCRERNLYAFCADYVRFWALYNYGGIYLDCDVEVFKSFDELLNMNTIITTEFDLDSSHLRRIECAILGCRAHNELFGKVVDLFNRSNCRPLDTWCAVLPDVFRYVIDENGYKINHIRKIRDESLEDHVVNILDNLKYFHQHNITKETFANHKFISEWGRCGHDYKLVFYDKIGEVIKYEEGQA